MNVMFSRLGLIRITCVSAIAVLLGGCFPMPWSNDDQFPDEVTPAKVAAGYYRVNTGDTLASIAAAYGRTEQEIIAWNHLTAPLAPDAILRVAPVPPQLHLIWPVHGVVVSGFQPGKTKGIVISGPANEQIAAAADGQVVYVGDAIKEYGQLIVIKHTNKLVTAYAHTGKPLVQEDDPVKAGQPIAGLLINQNGLSTVEFEVRFNGEQIDPMRYLFPANLSNDQ